MLLSKFRIAACAASILLCAGITLVSAQNPPAAPSAPAAAAPAPAPAATPAAPAPANLPTPGTTLTTNVENPYGLQALWEQGDMVAKTTLSILFIMSLGSWYIIFTKLYEQAKARRLGDEADKTFWNAGTVRQGADTLKEASPYRFIAESGLEATKKHVGLLGQIDLNSWIAMSIQRATENVQSRLQDGLAFLATVGSTAPFVGLFGTVWGIYNALVKIGVSGQASIDKVAGPVGESLIMTAIGLAVAVPAVLGYNWLVRRNKATLDRVRASGGDLHAVLLASNR
ncbi:MAG: MotA/TolQ/ExbB proton channel family protein [Betaproteobacteria bacterium]